MLLNTFRTNLQISIQEMLPNAYETLLTAQKGEIRGCQDSFKKLYNGSLSATQHSIILLNYLPHHHSHNFSHNSTSPPTAAMFVKMNLFAVLLAIPAVLAAPAAEAKAAGKQVLACACANEAGETKIDGYCPYIAGRNVDVDGQDYVSVVCSRPWRTSITDNIMRSASLPPHGQSTWIPASHLHSALATTLATPTPCARPSLFAH
jgi:hypothetical protein